MIRLVNRYLLLPFFLIMNASADSVEDISPLLIPLVEKSGLPSISVAVVSDGKLIARGASGVRELGGDDRVTVEDKYHLGSCTKPMTATLVAALVGEGELRWDTTIEEVLGRHMKVHPDYRDVTVEQLLAHVGGLPGKAPVLAWAEAWKNQGNMKPTRQRESFVKRMLEKKPAYPPGSKTVYSNQGYAVAGLMLEMLTRKSWEQLMREKVFEPLKMESAGFRAPEGRDQPRGHVKRKPVQPGIKADNPDAIAPAGVVHMTVSDWAKFALFHLNRDTSAGVIEQPELFEKLHATLSGSDSHGIGGWLVHDLDWAGGHCLQMTGSNTMWYCLLWIFPEKNQAYLVATNSGKNDAFNWCDKTVVQLMKKYSR